MTMHDGERVAVRGTSGIPYELSRDGAIHACTCPQWRKQKVPPEQRTCAHLRAHLGDAHENARIDPVSARVAAALDQARQSAQVAPVDPPEVRAEREAAVAAALARFPAVAARMRAVYDMPLPQHLAHAAGFWLGLTPDERDEVQVFLGPGLTGVGGWFAADGLSRIVENDERLYGRHRRDPPEFVPVFDGARHGSHWGLWYDDPRELPRQVAHNDAAGDGQTTLCKPTLLASLRRELLTDNFQLRALHARSIVAWLDENIARELAAHRDEQIAPPLARTRECLGDADPVVPGARLPADFIGPTAQRARLATYRDDPARARRWIAEALQELADGLPMRALFLARELHWLDHAELCDDAAELGIRAYQALGRTALAEVLRVHVDGRDLHAIDIYARAPTPPLVEAAEDGDDARVAALLAEPFEPATLTAAIDGVTAIPVLERLLAAAGPDAAIRKLAGTVDRLVDSHKTDIPAPEQSALLDHLLSRRTDAGPAFTRALAGKFPALALRLVDHLDVARPDAQGLFPLHRAVQAGAVEVVARLLTRGADPHARDVYGTTPHDRARSIWQERHGESEAIVDLLPPDARDAHSPR